MGERRCKTHVFFGAVPRPVFRPALGLRIIPLFRIRHESRFSRPCPPSPIPSLTSPHIFTSDFGGSTDPTSPQLKFPLPQS